jgi:hypothetical protein
MLKITEAIGRERQVDTAVSDSMDFSMATQ